MVELYLHFPIRLNSIVFKHRDNFTFIFAYEKLELVVYTYIVTVVASQCRVLHRKDVYHLILRLLTHNFSLLSLFLENKSSLMRSACCL
jgi:hypothetical protein